MKKYKCIGKREKAAILWSNQFDINSEYKEFNSKGANLLSEETLFLYNKNGLTFFVDKDQFEECTS
jgi:hypothetical protein